MGFPLEVFEEWAWNAMDLGIKVIPGQGGNPTNRVTAAVQRQIIEQYGWSEQG